MWLISTLRRGNSKTMSKHALMRFDADEFISHHKLRFLAFEGFIAAYTL